MKSAAASSIMRTLKGRTQCWANDLEANDPEFPGPRKIVCGLRSLMSNLSSIEIAGWIMRLDLILTNGRTALTSVR